VGLQAVGIRVNNMCFFAVGDIMIKRDGQVQEFPDLDAVANHTRLAGD